MRTTRSTTSQPVAWTFLHPTRDSQSDSTSVLGEMGVASRTYTYKGIEVRDSNDGRDRGKGVFATVELPECLLIPILAPRYEEDAPKAHVWSYTGGLHDLGLADGRPNPDCPTDQARGALGGLAITMMINEPCPDEKVNCEFWGNCVRTLRVIEPGEELLLYYGENYAFRTWPFDYNASIGLGKDKPPRQPKQATMASFVRYYYEREVVTYEEEDERPAQVMWQRPRIIPRRERP